MKISDVLRKLADELDAQNSIPDAPGNTQTDDSVFLPPLQQKQELLKRAVEVDNIYDDKLADQTHEDSDYNIDNNKDDDLDAIKRNAGIAAVIGLSDDEPLDS
jgi:hypothetical protein